jgi:hypothetical protein
MAAAKMALEDAKLDVTKVAHKDRFGAYYVYPCALIDTYVLCICTNMSCTCTGDQKTRVCVYIYIDMCVCVCVCVCEYWPPKFLCCLL